MPNADEMKTTAFEVAAVDPETALQSAQAALDAGDPERGRELAVSVHQAAVAQQDRLLEAKALLCMANCDRMESRMRRAHESSQLAAHLFKRIGDTANEAAALGTLAFVASCLGLNEEAVESGLLSVRLNEAFAGSAAQAISHMYLGVAYFCSSSFDEAQSALTRAAEIADRCGHPVSPLQILQNQMWAEAIRIASDRYSTGDLPSLERLQKITEKCLEMAKQADRETVLQGSVVVLRAMRYLGSSLRHCWTGDVAQARSDLETAHAWIEQYRSMSWVHALECWAQAEICWACGDWAGAEQCAGRMVALASRLEHEMLACLGHRLASQIFEVQGKHAEALGELRRLRTRERRIRVESLASRARVVDWQIEIRRSEVELRRLETASRQLELLSQQDPLTGIANRRCFEARIQALLSDARSFHAPICVALIDVDRFKFVNDTYSHVVGDSVLRQLAAILAAHVREQDLIARLAGDEFVVLFENADESAASAISKRIGAAVESFDWSRLAHGLRVTVSIGVAQADSGDALESLLHRSDLAMYAAKARQAVRSDGAIAGDL
jgi:diguanylate cyclase (GGDEF)-like protein